MSKLDLYPVPHPQVAGRVIDGEAVVILSESNQVNVYNPVGSRIWELADGTRSVKEIVELIINEYEVARERAEADVMSFLDQLVADHVLELSPFKAESPE
jgi:hypothetical protein